MERNKRLDLAERKSGEHGYTIRNSAEEKTGGLKSWTTAAWTQPQRLPGIRDRVRAAASPKMLAALQGKIPAWAAATRGGGESEGYRSRPSIPDSR